MYNLKYTNNCANKEDSIRSFFNITVNLEKNDMDSLFNYLQTEMKIDTACEIVPSNPKFGDYKIIYFDGSKERVIALIEKLKMQSFLRRKTKAIGKLSESQKMKMTSFQQRIR
jgi:hypothetical protein